MTAPTRIGTDNDWKEIGGGRVHTVALKNNGSLWTWGYNNNRQMGDGTSFSRLLPGRVGTRNDLAHIIAGLYHTVASQSSGIAWTCSTNWEDQLGIGKISESDFFTEIIKESDWAEVAAGFSHTVARKTDDNLWAWGSLGAVGRGSIFGPIGGTYDWGLPTGGAQPAPAPDDPPSPPTTLDTDGDGIPDAAALLAGTHPLGPASTFHIHSLQPAADGMHLQWSPLRHRRLAKPRLPTVPGKSCRVEYSQDLTQNHWHLLIAPLGTTLPKMLLPRRHHQPLA